MLTMYLLHKAGLQVCKFTGFTPCQATARLFILRRCMVYTGQTTSHWSFCRCKPGVCLDCFCCCDTYSEFF